MGGGSGFSLLRGSTGRDWQERHCVGWVLEVMARIFREGVLFVLYKAARVCGCVV